VAALARIIVRAVAAAPVNDGHRGGGFRWG